MMSGKVIDDRRQPYSYGKGVDRYNVRGDKLYCELCNYPIPMGARYTEYVAHTGYASDDFIVCEECDKAVEFCNMCGKPYLEGDVPARDVDASGANGMCEECLEEYYDTANDDISDRPPAQTTVEGSLKGKDYSPGEWVTFRKGNVTKQVYVGPDPTPQEQATAVDMAIERNPLSGNGTVPATPLPIDPPVPSPPDATVSAVNPQSLPPFIQNIKELSVNRHGNGRARKNGKGDNANGRKTYSSDLSDYKVTECGYCSKKKPLVTISIDVWSRAIRLMRACETEWLAYLKGRALDNGDYEINDIEVPPQEVEYAACENKGDPPADAIGIIHSHHNMTRYHSGIDADGIDQQNYVSIVISSQGASATVKRDLPCGRFVVMDADYEVLLPEVDVGQWIADSKAKMTRKTYNYQQGGGYAPLDREWQTQYEGG
jgi:hypothetical protein